jgi:hypothetical protein
LLWRHAWLARSRASWRQIAGSHQRKGADNPPRLAPGKCHEGHRFHPWHSPRISVDNPLWGAPRIHGEFLKLGFEVAQSSVAKYMSRRSASPSQRWLTFLRNHSTQIARHGPVHGSERRFRVALRLRHRQVAPQRSCLDQCNTSSDRGADRTSNHGSVSLE